MPGNHEVMGGSIDNFKTQFGAAQHTFDHKGTRVITLDTSSLSLRGGGFAQIRQLREQLDAAAEDRAVGSVMLIEHVPPHDPTVQKSSQLGDRKEAALVEQWLAGFRRTTGKGLPSSAAMSASSMPRTSTECRIWSTATRARRRRARPARAASPAGP
ncbi:hypothetical protein NKH18_03810 [Streptomyces sp. M10(2022)]